MFIANHYTEELIEESCYMKSFPNVDKYFWVSFNNHNHYSNLSIRRRNIIKWNTNMSKR